MAKKVKDTKSLLKWKKKRWYKVIAPKIFREVVLGESFVLDINSLRGKTVRVNLMNITGNVRKQNINMKFEVVDIQNDKALTNIINYKINAAALKRLVRRRRDKIELSVVYKSKDGIKFRIKPLIITRNNCANSIHTVMRKVVQADLYKYAEANTFEKLIVDVIAGRIQSDLKSKLKKIYPLRIVEIKEIKVEKSPKTKLTKVDVNYKVPVLEKAKKVVKKETKEKPKEEKNQK